MLIKTGEPHGLTHTTDKDAYHVHPIPYVDFAQRALIDAQSRYFTSHPEMKKYASALYWDITMEEAHG